MKFNSTAKAIAIATYIALVGARLFADADPCPKAQAKFKDDRGTAERSAALYRAKIAGATFDNKAFETQVRAQMFTQVREDIIDTAKAFNNAAVKEGHTKAGEKALTMSGKFLDTMANEKLDLLWAKESFQANLKTLRSQAETAFETARKDAVAKADTQIAAINGQMDGEEKKLNDNCSYAFLAQLIRILASINIDTRIEGGMLTIGQFKTYVPEIYGGEVRLGGQRIFDIPVIKGQNLEIGGTVIATAPQVVEGGKMIQWGNLKTDIIPKIDVNISRDNPGLGVKGKLFGKDFSF